MKAELGRTIVGLRAWVESYSQWDRAQAEKAFSDSDMEGETNIQHPGQVGGGEPEPEVAGEINWH